MGFSIKYTLDQIVIKSKESKNKISKITDSELQFLKQFKERLQRTI